MPPDRSGHPGLYRPRFGPLFILVVAIADDSAGVLHHRYSLREHPQAPTGMPPTPPAIASFTWKNGTPACGIPCPPIPGDPVGVTCVATAADGAGATMLLTIIWGNRGVPGHK
jgi:hypothetical protein